MLPEAQHAGATSVRISILEGSHCVAFAKVPVSGGGIQTKARSFASLKAQTEPSRSEASATAEAEVI